MKRNNLYNSRIYKIVNKDDSVNLYYVFNSATYYKSLYIIDEDVYNQKE